MKNEFKLTERSEEAKEVYFQGFHAGLKIAADLARASGSKLAADRIQTRLQISEATLAHFKAVYGK